MGTFIVAGWILCFVLLIILSIVQQDIFGKESGKLLLFLEVGLFGAAYLIIKLWRINKQNLSIGIGLIALALVFGFLGWFVHPDQIYSRSLERVSDWEEAFRQYRSEFSGGKRDPDAAVNLKRLTQEMAARRSEQHAAKIRYTGEPGFFRSTFITWSCWLVSAVSIGLAIRYLRRHTHGKA